MEIFWVRSSASRVRSAALAQIDDDARVATAAAQLRAQLPPLLSKGSKQQQGGVISSIFLLFSLVVGLKQGRRILVEQGTPDRNNKQILQSMKYNLFCVYMYGISYILPVIIQVFLSELILINRIQLVRNNPAGAK